VLVVESTVLAEPSIPPAEVAIAEVLEASPVEPTVLPTEVVVVIAEALEASPVTISRADPIAVPVELRMPEVEVIPGTCADKHSLDEPFGPVIAIRRTGKWVVRIVTVGARRRRIIESVVRTDLDTNGNLGVRWHCRERQRNQQSKILEIPHFRTSSPFRSGLRFSADSRISRRCYPANDL
jgi:hypothetical protein